MNAIKMATPRGKYSRGGGETCAVHGCNSNRRRIYLWKKEVCSTHNMLHEDCPCVLPYSFHIVPKEGERRLMWTRALQRKTLPVRAYVCSKHFLDGRPTEQNSVPTLELGHDRMSMKPGRRVLKRKFEDMNRNQDVKENLPRVEDHDIDIGLPPSPALQPTASVSVSTQACCSVEDVSTQWLDMSLQDHMYCGSLGHNDTVNGSTQTVTADVCSKGVNCDIKNKYMSYSSISNDSESHLYTGLTLEAFQTLVKVMSNIPTNIRFTMPVSDQILLCLMRLRLNLLFADLGHRFGISESHASNVFNSWLPILSEKLRNLIVWLPRETIRAVMPKSFKEQYPKTTVVIDCAETFMQRPKQLKTRGETYSNYKSHNTVKYLVAVAPHGQIMFISKGYGGRASDKFIVENSGFLKYLLPGDEVMADRGFTINDLLFPLRVKLNMPAFTRGNPQLSEEDVTETRRIAHVRIHVERAIRRLKVYKILSGIVPVSSVHKLDDILIVCAALVNMGSALIRDTDVEQDN